MTRSAEKPSRRNELLQRLAVHQLHREKVHAAALFDRVERDDVGMIEGCGRPRFTVEPRQPVLVRGHIRRQHLECNLSAEPSVEGSIHLAHAALAEVADDFIDAEATAGGKTTPAVILSPAG